MKEIINIILITICSLLILSSTSFGDEISHKQAASELLKIIHLDTLLNQTIDKMVELQLSSKPALKPYKNTLIKFFRKYMSAKSLENDLVNLYVDTFNESELRELISFYKTAIGQKSLKVMPKLAYKGGLLGQKRVNDHILELKQMIEDEATKIQKLQKNN